MFINNNSNKGISAPIVILVIIIAAIIGGGLVLWQYSEMEKETDNIPETQDTKIDISDWEIYRNEEYGFEMKYPKDWYVYPSIYYQAANAPNSITFSNLSEEVLKIKLEQESVENLYTLDIKIIDEQINNWLKAQEDWSETLGTDFFKEKINIGENEGYKLSSTTEEGKKGFSKVLFKEKKTYLIETLFPEKCRYEECKIFNQMLSSFRFIE